jgi:radical SAM protein with 4Fe4S-binding SPASM domain
MGIFLTDQDQLIVALDPDYFMRNEKDDICIFPRNPFFDQKKSRRLVISSPEAILLALCNGERNVSEIRCAISNILQVDIKVAAKIVVNCLSKFKDYLTIVDDSNIRNIVKYRPEDFILPGNKHFLRSGGPSAPELIMLIPTFSCDCHCRYCYAPRHQFFEEIALHDVERLTVQMKEMQIPSLVFSGGDPFCHAHIMGMIKACVDNDVRSVLATKAPLSGKTIKQLKRLGVAEIQVSIDSSDKDIVEYLVGRSNYFDAIVKSIRNMVSEGIAVNINSVLTSHNIRSMEMSIRDFAKWGIRQITLSQYTRSRFSHNDALFCQPGDLSSLEAMIPGLKKNLEPVNIYFKKIKDPLFMSRQEKTEFFKNRPVCNAGRNGLVILPDGSVTVCEILYDIKDFIIGNIKNERLSSIWDSPKRTDFAASGYKYLSREECKRCDQLIDCYTVRGKCFVRALQSHGDALRPDPFCPKSPPGNRLT